mmetsp:Transcript_9190/g.27665  ORF Transcript_9190/g.27665 Transcript_9190/m.27665 type:complete len:726 (-) Transcript_9190:1418-3595(-)|eukprot:CAMPEP_0198732356 /NCGR_PEP_ID=MMETSP1475-20131203/35243_1 /TAXON_ID= ORGANISM="Unidentified sp., Strain CCMP1999" /NCGR_SAMPLE_ID=MMETSP1475 /ASSEMBLY_ACC=CAM_ASM_001111 /LENGTH=725 /DNA_ID=CAMNT_0044495441 /DNA_START=84 /DNA_END=2261 /DNA_ORIENTATION=+
MFKKAFTVQGSNPLKSSDRKKLRSQISEEYSVSEDALQELLPTKNAEIVVLKLSNKATVWCIKEESGKAGRASAVNKYGQPIFFGLDINGKSRVFPTVYTMWPAPDMVPPLFTHAQVSKNILSGADLMLPGVLRLKDGKYGGMKRDETRCVVAAENPVPFAVGICCSSELEIEVTSRRGRALTVLHHYRDALWALGDHSVPNDCFSVDEVLPLRGDTVNDVEYESEGDTAPDELVVRPAPSDQQSASELAGEQQGFSALTDDQISGNEDSALEYAFAACSVNLSDKELPLSSSRFYSEHVSTVLPEFNFSKSSYKNFDLFLRKMAKQHYCKTKEVKGDLQLVQINEKRMENLVKDSGFKNNSELGAEADSDGAGNGSSNEGSSTTEDSPEDMDELLLMAFLQSVKAHLNPENDVEQFPMESSAFYTSVVLPSAPSGCTLDVKKSTHKKLSSFLKALSKIGLCSVKEKKGQLLVMGVNRNHPQVVSFRTYTGEKKDEKIRGKNEVRDEYVALSAMHVVFKAHQHHRPIFEDMNVNPRAEMTRKDAAEILERYIQKHRLISLDTKDRRKRVVDLDGRLRSALSKGFKKVDGDDLAGRDSMLFEELSAQFLDRLEIYHVVQVPGEGRKLRKGDIPKIQIVVEDRQGGRKHVTRVQGLQAHNLSPETVAMRCQVAFACSAGVQPVPGKSTKDLEIHLQGDVGKGLPDLLASEYKVPRKYIDVQKKGKKK